MHAPGWTGGHLGSRLDEWRGRLEACCAAPPTAGAARAAAAAACAATTARAAPVAAAAVQARVCHAHKHTATGVATAATSAAGAGGWAVVAHTTLPVTPPGRQADSSRRPTVHTAAGGPAAAFTSDSSSSSSRLSDRIREAPSAVALLDVIYDLAGDPRPHLITEAWVKLAFMASLERSSGARRGGGSSGAWGYGTGWEREAGGSNDRDPEASSSPQDLRAACHALEPLTRLKLEAMQFSQVSGLMWAWARLAQRIGGGAAPVPPALLADAVARAAECPTTAEEAGKVPDAVVQLARLAWGAAVLRVRYPRIWRKVSILAEALAPQAGPWEAASLMWALARARTLEGTAAEALCARMAVLGPHLGPADVANAVWALGAAQERRSTLQQALVAATVRLHQRLGPREVAAVAWGFAQLWGMRRPVQQPGRVALLRALSVASVACAPRMELRQAATTAWALASLGRQEPRRGRMGGVAAACSAAVEHAVGTLLARAAKLGLKGASQRDVGMLLQVIVKGTGASGDTGIGASTPPPVVAGLLRGTAQWVLAAPVADLRPAEVAMLLWGFCRTGLLRGGGGGGGEAAGQAAEADAGLGAAVAAVLVPRAAALCEGPAFAPSDLPRVAAALGALAAPQRMRQQWIQPDGSSGSIDSSRGASGSAATTQTAVRDQAHAALEQLVLPLAAVAGRYKLRELADAVSGYAVAGLHPEELFDVVSEVAQRPRVLDRSRAWECVRLLWAFAAAGHPDEPLFAALCDALGPLLPRARPATVARLAWACAACGYDDEDLLASVAERASDAAFMATCQPRDIAALAWALSVSEPPMRGPARATRDAALSSLAATGAAMLGEGRLSPPQLASLCWGVASAGTCDQRLLSDVADWVVARTGNSDSSTAAAAAALAGVPPCDAASLAWSLARCRHISGATPRTALLALAARCAAGLAAGDCTPEDASRAAWALAWSGILWLPPNGSSADEASGSSRQKQRQAALALARELARAAAADPDALEAGDLASLAMVLCLTGAAAQLDRHTGSSREAAKEAAAREQLARVHACAAGWGPGVFSAADAHLLYTSHEWLHSGGPSGSVDGSGVDVPAADAPVAPGGLPPKLLAAGKRAALRQAAASRDSPPTRAVLTALKALGAAAQPALPETVAASARSAAQLVGLGPEQLLPQILLKGMGKSSSSSNRTVLVVVASTEEQESATAPAVPCGWAAAAATLLTAGTATHRPDSDGQAAPCRVVVLLASELEAARRAGGDAAVAERVRSCLASCG